MTEKCLRAIEVNNLYSPGYYSTLLCNSDVKVPLESRYVFDIGSGGTKSKQVIIDTTNNKIVKTTKEFNIPMPYQKCIDESPDGKRLTKECMEMGLQSIMELVSAYGLSDVNSMKHAGIATAWARNAENAGEYFKMLAGYGLKVTVISQQEEGEIGYKSAESYYMPCDEHGRAAIVWDIGGGSYQLSTKEDDGSIHVHQGEFGSANFKQAVKDSILQKYGVFNTSRLLNKEEVLVAREFAEEKVSQVILGNKVLSTVMEKSCVDLVAIGQFMNLGIMPIIGDEHVYLKKLGEVIDTTFNLPCEEASSQFPSRSEEFLGVVQTDLILAEAIVKGLGKEEFMIINAKSVDYVATDVRFWPEDKSFYPSDMINSSMASLKDLHCLDLWSDTTDGMSVIFNV